MWLVIYTFNSKPALLSGTEKETEIKSAVFQEWKCPLNRWLFNWGLWLLTRVYSQNKLIVFISLEKGFPYSKCFACRKMGNLLTNDDLRMMDLILWPGIRSGKITQISPTRSTRCVIPDGVKQRLAFISPFFSLPGFAYYCITAHRGYQMLSKVTSLHTPGQEILPTLTL